jgi:hypothetical protein
MGRTLESSRLDANVALLTDRSRAGIGRVISLALGEGGSRAIKKDSMSNVAIEERCQSLRECILQ